MRTIRTRLAGLAAAAVLAAGTTGAAAQTTGVTDDTIRIGALGALTGATAFIGAPGRDGLTLAFDAINAAGGINGRQVDLVFEHAFTPGESVAAAKKLVESDGVFVLVLASGSTGAAAAADYVRETGIPTYNIFRAPPPDHPHAGRKRRSSHKRHSRPQAHLGGGPRPTSPTRRKPPTRKSSGLPRRPPMPFPAVPNPRRRPAPFLEARGHQRRVIEEFEQERAPTYTSSKVISFAREGVDSCDRHGLVHRGRGFRHSGKAPEVGSTERDLGARRASAVKQRHRCPFHRQREPEKPSGGLTSQTWPRLSSRQPRRGDRGPFEGGPWDGEKVRRAPRRAGRTSTTSSAVFGPSAYSPGKPRRSRARGEGPTKPGRAWIAAWTSLVETLVSLRLGGLRRDLFPRGFSPHRETRATTKTLGVAPHHRPAFCGRWWIEPADVPGRTRRAARGGGQAPRCEGSGGTLGETPDGSSSGGRGKFRAAIYCASPALGPRGLHPQGGPRIVTFALRTGS